MYSSKGLPAETSQTPWTLEDVERLRLLLEEKARNTAVAVIIFWILAQTHLVSSPFL